MNRKIFAVAAFAAVFLKLPYEAGRSFVVVQGYVAPPTHVNKDLYALDFSQNGCDGYGKLALASGGGTVMLAQENGYNGGYGTQALVMNDSRIVARYAHLIPETIPVTAGDIVVQGEPLGEIGNTGLVAGAACPAHPGTHLHFAMYGEQADGSFIPYLPEPISGYVGIRAGNWYLSDNAITFATVPGAAAIIARMTHTVFEEGNSEEHSSAGGAIHGTSGSGGGEAGDGTGGKPPPQDAPVAMSGEILGAATSAASDTAGQAVIGGGIALSGGVSAEPAPSPVSPIPLPPSPMQPDPMDAFATTTPSSTESVATSSHSSAPIAPVITITNSSFNSTTLAVDISWQSATGTGIAATGTATSGLIVYQVFSSSTLIATTTALNFSYPVLTSDYGRQLQFVITGIIGSDGADGDDNSSTVSTVSTAPVSLPDWWRVIQSADDATSNGSWYDDTWYDLGTGFYGTIRSLTLEGMINNSDHFASHLWLDEYIDAAYMRLNKTYTLSDSAPFTNGMRKITISDLNIALQPNKYYRLRTYQDYQNRSVILAGMSATGTAMWNEFIGGTGRVEHQYPFYPYLAAIMIPDYPPLMPPTTPASITIAFDTLTSAIKLSWPPSTDPDTTSSLLAYQINIAGSHGSTTPFSLDPAGWRSVGNHLETSTPVVFGDSYIIGVRAIDDLDNTSTPLVEPWNFPAGYFPVQQQLDHSAQLPDGGTQSIVFHAPVTLHSIAFFVVSNPNSAYCCAESVVNIKTDASGTPGAIIATSGAAETGYADPPRELTYPFSPATVLPAGTYWFEVAPDARPNNDPTYVLGSMSDAYPGGGWSTAPGQDAYFKIQE